MSRRRWLVWVGFFLGCGPAVAEPGGSTGTSGDSTGASEASVGSTVSAADTTTTTAVSSETSEDTIDSGFVDFGHLIPDAPTPGCDPESGAERASAIWVANRAEGTVSKIDTVRGQEVGRYLVAPADAAPQTISVSRNGDVVVSTDHGGVVMIHGNLEDCSDPNGTSQGADDVRAFPDGCVGWFAPMVYEHQRTAVWTSGTLDAESCRYEGAQVWTSGIQDGEVEVRRLGPEGGETKDVTAVVGLAPSVYGIYGAAVDSGNNLWGVQYATDARLVRVDHETLEVELVDLPPDAVYYGMAVDASDRVWLCSGQAQRYDPATGDWDTAPSTSAPSPCAVDAQGRLWIGGATINAIDVDTLEVVASLSPPVGSFGLGVDFQGRIWTVGAGAGQVYGLDADGGGMSTVSGLANDAYAYGDLGGLGLTIVGS